MSDLKFWDVFIDPLWLRHNLRKKYKVIRVPTNAAWGTSNVNGGFTPLPLYCQVNTSITASSRGLGNCIAWGLNSGGINRVCIDWTKRMELSFLIIRGSTDAEAVARVQLKEIGTEGVLAEMGIGIQMSNWVMIGEAYGTARQTTGTLKTLTNQRLTRVKIVLTGSTVEFWVDGVLVESLTGTAVPPVAGALTGYLVLSIVNGVTGGANVYIEVSNIEVVQAW